MNIPNKLTLLRIFLVIPLITLFCVYIWYVQCVDENNAKYFLYANGAIFTISMITDFIDGKLARKNNQITDFGKLFDPLADKIIVSTTLIFLAIFQQTYLILVVLFILRDLIVDGSRNVAAKNNLKVEASIYGKLKTFIQTFGIVLIMFAFPSISNMKWWIKLLLNIPMIIALIFSLISGYFYFKQIWPIIKKDK